MPLIPLAPLTQWQWQLNARSQFEVSGITTGSADAQLVARWLQGKGWSDLEPCTTPRQWQAFELQRAGLNAFFNIEFQLPVSALVTGDNAFCWISLSGVPVLDEAGQCTGYRGVVRDISLEKNAQATIASLAWSDQLTGLSNRRLLLDRLHSVQSSSARSQEHGALIYVDVDNFKSLNGMLGHVVADALLVEVGARLSTCTRAADTVARFGGDVFVVLATSLGKDADLAAQAAGTIARKMTLALAKPFASAAHGVSLTGSLGVYIFRGSEHSVDTVLERAELALGQAKSEGGNVTRYFDPAVQAQITHITKVEKELSAALLADQLLLFYQPVVDLQRSVLGYEALIRWQHPQQGLVGPAHFVQIAERSGLIVPMGEWVLRAACRQLALFATHEELSKRSIAVNLSARQLAHPDFVSTVKQILNTTGAPPWRLKLEITESMLLTDIDQTIEKLHALSSMGIQLSLDDFGTGYSSLSYLKKLPLTQLKIDQSFIRELLTDPVDAAIVRTILQLAKSLGMSVIAEGVELEGQQIVLSNMGCKQFQGYLFGKPGPLE